MLALYLVALGFGGTLLGASVLFGGEHHHGDGGGVHDVGDALAWLPISSLRFWTFFLGFGGGVGALLTLAGVGSVPLIAALAAATGWVTGVGAVATIRALKAGSVSSALGPGDLPGATGTVTIGIDAGDVGKVRFLAKGRQVDLLAAGEDGVAIPSGARVVVVGHDGDKVIVAPEPDAES